MKLTPLLLLSALFLVSSLAASAFAEPVLDTDGNELKRGVEYYILPAVTDVGGGLSKKSRNNSCLYHVVMPPLPADDGLPLTFSPVVPEEDTVHLSTDLIIVFQVFDICAQIQEWKLTYDEADGRYYVTTGTIIENPGREAINNRFKIEKNQGVYKLVFCPSVSDESRPVCGDLGFYNEGGERLLGLRDDARFPFPFEFKRA